MLTGQAWSEANKPEVELRDVDAEGFECMLRLMYGGKLEISTDNVLQLLATANRFDVVPLISASVDFLLKHTSSEHALQMLEVGVQYRLQQLVDKCTQLILTDEEVLFCPEMLELSSEAITALLKDEQWNCSEDEVFHFAIKWANHQASEPQKLIPILEEYIRWPQLSVEILRRLADQGKVATGEAPADTHAMVSRLVVDPKLIFDALFHKLEPQPGKPGDQQPDHPRYRPRSGSMLFCWVPTAKITISGAWGESARHTSSHGFTGVRGDRVMRNGVYNWSVKIMETQSSYLFVGIAEANDENEVAWRSTGRMIYCLDSRSFHAGSGTNHPKGDRVIRAGDVLHIELNLREMTLSFGVGETRAMETLFRHLPPTAYVAAVDFRDCGDKVCLLSSPWRRDEKRESHMRWTIMD